MTRFLRYAAEHGRKLRMMLYLDGALVQKTASVESFTEESVTLTLSGRKKPITIPASDILSCDYARGDHGED